MPGVPELKQFRIEQAGNGVLHLVFDMPGRTMNVFSNAAIEELGRFADWLPKSDVTGVVIRSGKPSAFCAGADLSNRPDTGAASEGDSRAKHLYKEAVRLFRNRKPIVAAVHGAAIGGGLGLALVADFRVTCQEARFSANFTRLGFHPGFGMTMTLPRVVGPQQAALLFYTGRRIPGDEAVRIGLADFLVDRSEVRNTAQALALEIALSAPLAVMSTRETLRRALADAVEAATERELVEQEWLRRTADFKEGVAAMAGRHLPNFVGR